MYILKNALRNINRTKGRSFLIGLIVIIIATSSCIGLSIRQAAEKAKTQTLDLMSVTAQISIDRSKLMQQSSDSGTFDRSTFFSSMTNSIGLDEMLIYKEAPSVKSFYYTLTASVNGSDTLEPVDTSDTTTTDTTAAGTVTSNTSATDTTTSDTTSTDTTASDTSGTTGNSGTNNSDTTATNQNQNNAGGGMGGRMFGTQGDFTVVGYSSEEAMTGFLAGTSTLKEGAMFDTTSDSMDCIISDELAVYDGLTVGEDIVLANPNDETEVYTLHVVGIYNNSQSAVTTSNNMRGFSTSSDPANQIYMSYASMKSIATASEAVAVVTTNDAGRETSTKITTQIAGTYVFNSVDDYNAFDSEARALGLDDKYTISSTDISNYEQSLVPLETLSSMAGYFLVVILIIGAIILVVLNIFNTRERKYEIGVLTAIGMKKSKVALQFVIEIIAITIIAVFIGGAVGSVASVPVTNALLANQVEAQTSTITSQEGAFGRSSEGGNFGGGNFGGGNFGGGRAGNNFMNLRNSANVDYISQINAAVNFSVLLELLGLCLLLAIASSSVAVTSIMRYEPLKILSNRD